MKQQIPEKQQALEFVNFYGSYITKQKYIELMKDPEEREAYLDYLKS